MSAIYERKKCPKSSFWLNLIKEAIKKICDKILLDNDMTAILTDEFSKSVYKRKRITISKASVSSFSNYLCPSSFQFFEKFLSILKTTNFNIPEDFNMIYILFLNKPEKVFKKLEVHRKKSMQDPSMPILKSKENQSFGGTVFILLLTLPS